MILVEKGSSVPKAMTWLPIWALTIALTIPVTAVKRSRQENPARWNLSLGLLGGLVVLILRLIAIQQGLF